MATLTEQYDLNMLMDENSYNELIESFNILNEGIFDIPKNKVKSILGKFKSVLQSKDEEKIKKFVLKHKGLVQDEKKIESRTMKVLKKMGYSQVEIDNARTSIRRLFAGVLHLTGFISLIGIIAIVVAAVKADKRGISLSEAMDQFIKEFKESTKKGSQGTYSKNFDWTFNSILGYFGGIIIMSVGAGLESMVVMGAGWLILLACAVILIVASFSFLYKAATTPDRM